MHAAMLEAERARGHTGDNPWVGCVIVNVRGEIVGRGYTRGPGEDHAEIDALRMARSNNVDLAGATLYSTLEPCSFHGRTPACAKVVATAGVSTLVFGIRDPHPRVNGVGAAMVRDAGVAVMEGVCALEILRQLAPWIFVHHRHEPQRRARALYEAGLAFEETVTMLATTYGVSHTDAARVVETLRQE
jgi:diaminohydroxyphosphoribosylaminopyrimidine deaminase / 5-amino-6-(5-phosphoribosylamino)uracil reductase